MFESLKAQILKLMFELSGIARKRIFKNIGDLKMPQMFALIFIKERNPKMRDIAKVLGIKDASATALVEKLVNKGLVKRCSNKKDRRVVSLCLTETGKNFIERSHKNISKEVFIFDCLTESEQKQFIDILKKLINQP